MKIRRLNTGNYFGYAKAYYFFIYRRPHGGWCARIGKNGVWLVGEGYLGASLNTLLKAKNWVSNIIFKDREILIALEN